VYLNLENIPFLNLYKLTVFRPKCPNHFRHHCPNETVIGVRFAPFFALLLKRERKRMSSVNDGLNFYDQIKLYPYYKILH